MKMNNSKSIHKYYMRAKREKSLHVCVDEEKYLGTANLNVPTRLNNDQADRYTLNLEVLNHNNDFMLTNNSNDLNTNCALSASPEISLPSNSCNDFKINLKRWALQHNITHASLNDLLSLLKSTVHTNLPSDARTLLGTTRTVHTRVVDPGHYYHFGLHYCLEKLINNLSESSRTLNTIELNINVDGLPLFKSSTNQAYPILCNIVGNNTVEMVGIYSGYEKPKDSNLFLAEFVNDAINIINNGIFINGALYHIRIKAFVCDAPAKAYIKCIKSHSGYSSCTKCYIEGDYVDGHVCFPNVTSIHSRTDLEFRSKLDENHHNGTSIIERIPNINMINSFPLDYMHLICLGVVKKLLLLWCCGKPSTKISFEKISTISSSLIKLSSHVPNEFNRKPRSLNEIRRWKATEFRQLLFYTGPVVLKNNINKDRYKNFMALHVAVTILSNSRYLIHIEYASQLLKYFVKTFKVLYGSGNMSFNVHNLLHLTQDVKEHGILDNFSAFPFENFLQSVLKSLRKCDKPLQQIIKRHSEMQNANYNCVKSDEMYPIFKNEHYVTSILMNLEFTKHFKTAVFKSFILCTKEPDNCCCLTNGDIIIIRDIVLFQNEYKFVGSKYLYLTATYYSPCESTDFGIVEANENDLDIVKLYDYQNVAYKCVQFKFYSKCIIFPLIHTR